MTPTIRLIIAGSRTVDPTDEQIDDAVSRIVMRAVFGLPGCPLPPDRKPETFIAEVICGKASGADSAGERWAKTRGVPVHLEPVTEEDYRVHGRYLGPKMRNRRMAERGTHALCWWDGTSGGTADMACRMVARGRPVVVIPTKPRAGKRRSR